MEPSDEDLSRYLPDLDRARKRFEMPPGEPSEVERLAMLVVHALLIRRTSFAEVMASPPDKLERGEPPIPTDFEVHHHVRIDEALGGGGPCAACVERPGKRRCRVCGGTGKLFSSRACSCDGGWITCPTCGGSALQTAARLRYYTDAPTLLNEAYMPSHVGHVPSLFRLESTMEEDIEYRAPLPEPMRCHDLTGRVQGSAYRGGGRMVAPDFHGHAFGDAIDKALAGLAAVGAGASIVRYEIRAYGWPFFLLRWPGFPYFALYADRHGNPKLFVDR